MKTEYLKKKLKIFFTCFCLSFGISLMLGGMYVFMAGFHNIDLSVNMLRVAYFHNLDYSEFRDQTLFGNVITYDEGYMLGMFQLIASMIILLVGSSMFYSALGNLRIKED